MSEEVSRTRVRVNQITSLANDLALALAAPSLRIEAPVPGRSVVGIEVPNTAASVVTMRSVMETGVFQRSSAKSKLTLPLGKSVSGEPVVADLTKKNVPFPILFENQSYVDYGLITAFGGYLFGKVLLQMHGAVGPIAFVLATAVLLGGGYLMRRFEARLSEAAERALPGPLESAIKAKKI